MMLASRIDNLAQILNLGGTGEKKAFIQSTINSLQMLQIFIQNIKTFCGEPQEGWKTLLVKCIKEYETLIVKFNSLVNTEYWYKEIDHETPSTLIEKLHVNSNVGWPKIKDLADTMITLYSSYFEILDGIDDNSPEFEGYWPNETIKIISRELTKLQNNLSTSSISNSPLSQKLQFQSSLNSLNQLQFLINMITEIKSGQYFLRMKTPSPIPD